MGRLPGFDYRRPFYYMVTLKRRPGLPDFSLLAPPGAPPPRDAEGRECWLLANPVTKAFAEVIRGFSGKRRGIEPVKHFVVMPDHLHLLLRIEDTPDRLPLGTYVLHLERALCAAFWAAQGADGTGTVLQDEDGTGTSGFGRAVPVPPVFERDWHDWIVMKRGQLDAFARYILDNPRRAWLRRENRRFFTRLGKLPFAGHEWFAYGNPALLELPVLEPFRCSRSWAADGPEWCEAVARASRIGPRRRGCRDLPQPLRKGLRKRHFQGRRFVRRPRARRLPRPLASRPRQGNPLRRGPDALPLPLPPANPPAPTMPPSTAAATKWATSSSLQKHDPLFANLPESGKRMEEDQRSTPHLPNKTAKTSSRAKTAHDRRHHRGRRRIAGRKPGFLAP